MTEELSKGFTGIEINGVRFSNIKEMLSYMNKQRVRIIDLEKENAVFEEDRDKYRNMVFDKIAQLDQAKEIINELLMNSYDENTREKALNFLYPDKKEDK